MYDQSGENSSLWATTARITPHQVLTADLTVDVIVIGGGITGVTAAYLLKRAGRRVALFEKDRCGLGQTAQTTAHVSTVPDVPLSRLIDLHGVDRTRTIWDAGFAAVSRLRSIVRDERINCDFGWMRGCLHGSSSMDRSAARAAIIREAEAAESLGIDATYVDHAQDVGQPALYFEGQARLHPLRYLGVLLDRIKGDGSHVFEQTEVGDVDAERISVTARGFRVNASHIIVATHAPLERALPAGNLSWPVLIEPRTSYIVSAVASSCPLREGLYWEHAASAGEYLRVESRDEQVNITLGGFDHHVNEPARSDDPFGKLETRLAERVPGARLRRRWSGQVLETSDGLPCIGHVTPRVFVATGFSGNGVTFGTLAGMMAVDAAAGRPNPWRDLFGMSRGRVSGAAKAVNTDRYQTLREPQRAT